METKDLKCENNPEHTLFIYNGIFHCLVCNKDNQNNVKVLTENFNYVKNICFNMPVECKYCHDSLYHGHQNTNCGQIIILNNQSSWDHEGYCDIDCYYRNKWIVSAKFSNYRNCELDLSVLLNFDQYPLLDLDGHMGSTNYIDFLNIPDMKNSSFRTGIDKYNRKFLAIMVRDRLTKEEGVFTIFQRYIKDSHTWTHGENNLSTIMQFHISGCINITHYQEYIDFVKNWGNRFFEIFPKVDDFSIIPPTIVIRSEDKLCNCFRCYQHYYICNPEKCKCNAETLPIIIIEMHNNQIKEWLREETKQT